MNPREPETRAGEAARPPGEAGSHDPPEPLGVAPRAQGGVLRQKMKGEMWARASKAGAPAR